MKRLPIADPIRTSEILHHYHLQAKKSLGQNFLTNPAVINSIVTTAEIALGDQVIEVGPGIGALTEQILAQGAKLLAYEIDGKLIEVLTNELPADAQIKILHQDVLQTDFNKDFEGYFDPTKPVKVVANLPYYITTPIIFRFLESGIPLESLTVMMQKEVADRIEAQPGKKDFGPLSIAVQLDMESHIALNVPPSSFTPAPKVDSAVVQIVRKAQPIRLPNKDLFNKIVKVSFAQRRKTIYNNLKHLVGQELQTIDDLHELLRAAAIAENRRAEQLSIADYLKLTELVDAK